MKSLSLLLLVPLLMFTAPGAESHTYHLGDCPIVEPMSNFQMSKFLGVWYAVQKTSTGSRCLTYNFTVGEEPGEYKIEQTSEHPVLGIASVDNKYHYTGELKANAEVPSRMTVKFPLSVAGTASYIVFMTDYESYAGIFSCQKLPAGNRRSATILSRTKTLDKIVIDKIRTRLMNSGVNPFDLSIIDQSKCPSTTDVDININKETFSPKSIAGVIRKAGEKLGDGVETAAEGIGSVYDSVKSKPEEEEIELP